MALPSRRRPRTAQAPHPRRAAGPRTRSPLPGWVDDTTLRRAIGGLLLVLAALQLVLTWRSPDTARVGSSRAAAIGTGAAAGFATMTANAAGPVMTLYLVAQGVEKRRFLGTSAIFFFGVNCARCRSASGSVSSASRRFWRTALLAPLVLVGTWIGLHTARRLSQTRFDQAVLAATVVSAWPSSSAESRGECA